jgi:excisionase family DNA binding protein
MVTTLLTIRAAAARLGIGKDLLYKLVALDEFPHYKIGTRIRILDTDIERWLETNKRGAACFNGSNATEAARDGSTPTRIQ